MKENDCLMQFASSTKVNHATRVTTLQLKQPNSFYSVVVVFVINNFLFIP